MMIFFIGILGSGCSSGDVEGNVEEQERGIQEQNVIEENTRNVEEEPEQKKTFEIPEVNPDFGNEEKPNDNGTIEIPKVDPNF